jgi:hypothetical protein
MLSQDGQLVLVAEANEPVSSTVDLIIVPNLTHDASHGNQTAANARPCGSAPRPCALSAERDAPRALWDARHRVKVSLMVGGSCRCCRQRPSGQLRPEDAGEEMGAIAGAMGEVDGIPVCRNSPSLGGAFG